MTSPRSFGEVVLIDGIGSEFSASTSMAGSLAFSPSPTSPGGSRRGRPLVRVHPWTISEEGKRADRGQYGCIVPVLDAAVGRSPGCRLGRASLHGPGDLPKRRRAGDIAPYLELPGRRSSRDGRTGETASGSSSLPQTHGGPSSPASIPPPGMLGARLPVLSDPSLTARSTILSL
jgi:hypothetical protein